MKYIFIIFLFIILGIMLLNHHNKTNQNKEINNIDQINDDSIIKILKPINFILVKNIEEKIKLDRKIELFNFYSDNIKNLPNENNTIIFDQLKLLKQDILNILESYTLSIDTYINRQLLQTTINDMDLFLSSELKKLGIIIEQYLYVRNFNSHIKIPDNPKPFNYHKDIFSSYSYHIH